MTLYDYLKSAIRRCYVIDIFHDDSTHGTKYNVTQRERDLGRIYFTDILMETAPSLEISNKIIVWANSVINHDLNQLPWDNYYAI